MSEITEIKLMPTHEELVLQVETLTDMCKRLEEVCGLQGNINLKLITSIRECQQRIEILEGNRQKPNALILPPRLNS